MMKRNLWVLFVPLGDVYAFSAKGFTQKSKRKLHAPSCTSPGVYVNLQKSGDCVQTRRHEHGYHRGELYALDPSSIVEDDSSTAAATTMTSAAQWHKNRRKLMLSKYSSQILPLEQQSHGLFVGLPLLLLANVSLTWMALWSETLTLPGIFLLAAFPGSILSLWQLQILHDALHSSLLPKPTFQNTSKLMKKIIRHRNKIQKFILYFGSFPSAYGYYLYLQYGHLTHHKVLGDPEKVSLAQLFNSTQTNFEDGDLLFAVHRMNLVGELGPKVKYRLPGNDRETETVISIGSMGFSTWKTGRAIRNAMTFTATFLFERMMLILNDFVVALMGRNYFFPNKPKEFHRQGATYARWSVLVRLGLCYLAKSYKPLLFLYLAETLWSIPPHPACAMFITNHGSKEDDEKDGQCIPSSSTYVGRWYSVLTLGTNYHVEHHDFPTIPLHELGKLRQIAPEFYREGTKDNIWSIMKNTFARPEFYACMNAASVAEL